MKLTKTPDGYVVQVPADVVAALGLREGDDVDLHKIADGASPLSEAEKDQLIQRMRMLAKPLPPGYKFDREKANAR